MLIDWLVVTCPVVLLSPLTPQPERDNLTPSLSPSPQVNTGKYKQGMAMFNQLLEREPKLIAAYLGRGTAQALQGNLAAASKDFGKAVEIDPTCAGDEMR